MRISDWSSDVCSSDLLLGKIPAATLDLRQGIRGFAHSGKDRVVIISHGFVQPRRRSCMLRAKFTALKNRQVNGWTRAIVDGIDSNQIAQADCLHSDQSLKVNIREKRLPSDLPPRRIWGSRVLPP